MRTRGRRVGDVYADGAGARVDDPVAPAVPSAPRAHDASRPNRHTTADLFDGRPAMPVLVPAARGALAPSARHLWLALRCTDLPLAVLGGARTANAGARDDVPLAVVDGTHAQRVVLACNALATRLGVRPGLKLNAAHALAPGLEVRDRVPLLEERRLQALGRWGTGYTPFVSLEPPDTLLLEVRGSLRLFGGAPALVARALRELEAHGHEVAHALAPTPRAALWLARGASGTLVESPANLSGALSALPVAAAAWPERTYEQLARLGVRTFGELRRLPRDGLARRFDAAVLAELDEAFGLAPAPRRRHVVPERFQERVELTCELESFGHMEPAIDRLLERMGRFLRVRDAGVARIALTFLHRKAPPTCVPIGRAAACGDGREWRLLVRERLGRVQLPEAALAIALRTSVALPLAGASEALPGLAAEQVQANAWALLDRLRARLGDAAVSGVCLVPEHRPERAWRRVTPRDEAAATGRASTARGRVPAPGVAGLRGAVAAAAPGAEVAAASAAPADLPWVPVRASRRRVPAAEAPSLPPAPRPLWLLAEPERLRVHHGQPCHDGALRFEAGPERIESGWWDGSDVVRDYYVATTRTGVRLWIYREREPEAARDGPRWFLHGVFG